MLKAQPACEVRHLGADKKQVLPYGDTLHGSGCGCPENWSRTTRAADLADSAFFQAFHRFQQGSLTPCRHLTVAYMLPHHNVVSLVYNFTSGPSRMTCLIHDTTFP